MSAFHGQNGIVTGAANGIGRATALRLAELGANVLAVDIDAAGLEQTVGMAPDTGTISSFELDLLGVDSGDQLIARANESLGRIDFFFNNAGVEGPRKPLTQLTDDEWESVFAINVTACFRTLRAVVPAMREAGGRIVNIGSCLSTVGARNTSSYSASKHAVVGITRCLSAEEAGDGIAVNCITAGPTATALHDRAEASFKPTTAQEQGRRSVESMIPMGRLGTPEEVAELAVFLLSPSIPFLTGATIALDGGMTAALYRA